MQSLVRRYGWLTASVLLGLLACHGTPQTTEATLAKETGEIKSVIQRQVVDPDRRQRLLSTVDGIDAALNSHAADYVRFVEEYRRLNDSYDTQQQEVEALFSRYEQRRKVGVARLLELHYQMIRLTTPEEWPAIGKVEAEMLQASMAVPK